MSDTPKVGDRVRVTVVAEVVNHSGPLGPGYPTAVVELRYPTDSVSVDDVEILERADDPAQDPVGTVRRWDDAIVSWVKVDRDAWARVPNGGLHSHFCDEAMTGGTIIGAVPGTPASAAVATPVEYYRGNIFNAVCRLKGNVVDFYSDNEWMKSAGEAEEIRESDDWTKLDGKPSDVN